MAVVGGLLGRKDIEMQCQDPRLFNQSVLGSHLSPPTYLPVIYMTSRMFTSLSLSIPVCKMGIMTVTTSQACKWENVQCLPPLLQTHYVTLPSLQSLPLNRGRLKEGSLLFPRKVVLDQHILKVAPFFLEREGYMEGGAIRIIQKFPHLLLVPTPHTIHENPAGELV